MPADADRSTLVKAALRCFNRLSERSILGRENLSLFCGVAL